MFDAQTVFFRWAAAQSAAVGLTLFALGVVYAFQGFRLARGLIAISNAVVGWGIGLVLGALTGIPAMIAGGAGAVVAGLLAIAYYRAAIVMASLFTFAGLAYYLARQFDLAGQIPLYALGLGMCGGIVAARSYLRSLPVLLTTMHGAALLVLAFVALSSSLVPSLGSTFRGWSASIGLLVPMLLTMISVMGYSCQANLRQGDMTTGSSDSWSKGGV